MRLIERPRIRDRSLPRWLAALIAYLLFLVVFGLIVLIVIPPIVREVEQVGSQLPTYVKDFETWANDNEQFRELNEKYDITKQLSEQASNLPSKLGDAAGAAQEVTVGILNNLIEAIVVLTLGYFLLLDGARQFVLATARLRPDHRERHGGSAPARQRSSALTSRSTCCWQRSAVSSPGSSSNCSESISRCPWR